MKKLSVLLALLVSTVSFAEKERENSIDLGLGVFYRNSVFALPKALLRMRFCRKGS